jgi:hypothetical protein
MKKKKDSQEQTSSSLWLTRKVQNGKYPPIYLSNKYICQVWDKYFVGLTLKHPNNC